MSRIHWIVVLLVVSMAVPLDAVDADAGSLACELRSNDTPARIRECVTLTGVRQDQAVFQIIADLTGGTRAVGTAGNRASVDYVVGRLRAAGYNPTVQPFDFVNFVVLGASVLADTTTGQQFVERRDFVLVDQTDRGDVTAPVTAVDIQIGRDNRTTSGCEAADFAAFPAGNIALIQRGTCTVRTKAENAAAAGAAGVIVFNQGDSPLRDGLPRLSLTQDNQAGIPVVATSAAVGAQLAATPDHLVRLFANTARKEDTTWNVLAETSTGRDDNVVMVGAHLDSVPAGPGINDDGSGAGAILEVADALSHTPVENKVRFAWWGGEELGTVGSALYLSDLPPEQRAKIALYLNFDMIGSPNPANFVYDGDGSEFGTTAPEGSAAIEAALNGFYADRGLPSEPTRIEFSSDYAIFFVNDIPFGGVFSGADGIKTPEQAQRYGGTADQPFDPCYHQACDRLDNVDLGALAVNADAVAEATVTYAMSTASVNGQPAATADREPLPVTEDMLVAQNAA